MTAHSKPSPVTTSNVMPAENFDHARLLPPVKALPADWDKRLCGEGDPARLSGEELRYVGMPVSGICTGQVYLSGDGRLCHWDVFKAYGGRTDTGDPHGPHYAHPQIPDQPFLIGFALQCAGSQAGPLDAQGFRNVEFEGSYPVGNVWLSDPDCPIGVQLEAFSPFIPLDVEDSGLPATVLNYRFSNLSGIDQNFSVGAWLENAVYPFEPKPQGRRIIELSSTPTSATLHCHATAASAAKLTALEA